MSGTAGETGLSCETRRSARHHRYAPYTSAESRPTIEGRDLGASIVALVVAAGVSSEGVAGVRAL